MISVRGQLAIRTIHGSNGDFNVGRLIADIGEFVVKDAEIDQYQEGKYEGDFVISRISPYSYNSNGRFVVEVRALLSGMSISSIDKLTPTDANLMTTQEVDPADEEALKQIVVKSDNPLEDTTQFGGDIPVKPKRIQKAEMTTENETEDDQELFGILWPLGDIVKLDATVNRMQFRQQSARLGKLGYEFKEATQDWHLVKH